jgi:hypothetical protein
MAQIRAGGEHLAQQHQPLRRGDQHADVAVLQDEGHLLRLEDRVDRDEHRASGGGAEAGDHGFDALVEVDGDAVAASGRCSVISV